MSASERRAKANLTAVYEKAFVEHYDPELATYGSLGAARITISRIAKLPHVIAAEDGTAGALSETQRIRLRDRVVKDLVEAWSGWTGERDARTPEDILDRRRQR